MDAKSLVIFSKTYVQLEEIEVELRSCTIQGHTPELNDCYVDRNIKNALKGLKYQIEQSVKRYE